MGQTFALNFLVNVATRVAPFAHRTYDTYNWTRVGQYQCAGYVKAKTPRTARHTCIMCTNGIGSPVRQREASPKVLKVCTRYRGILKR